MSNKNNPGEEINFEALLEDYERDRVPQEKTKSWLQMGLVWAGVGISLGLLITGGAIGAGLTLPQSLGASLLGGVVLSLVAALIGVIGANTKLSTAMIGRFTFGDKGSFLVALVLAITNFGWFGVQLGLFGSTAKTAMEMGFGISGNTNLLIIVGGILMVATATIGYKALQRLSILAVPLLSILMIASIVRVLGDYSWAELWRQAPPDDAFGLGTGISLAISSFIVGAVVAPDVTRYARSAADAVGASIFGFVLSVPAVLFVGSLLAQATGTPDIVDIMIALGWGLFAFFVLMLAQWTSNDNNLYCASLGLSVMFRQWKKWRLAIVSGAAGIILAVWGIYDQFIPFLSTLGILVPSLGGVMAADYFLFNRSIYELGAMERIPGIRVLSYISWGIGTVFAFLTSFTGLVLTTVPALDGFLIAVLVHVVLYKIFTTYRKEEGQIDIAL